MELQLALRLSRLLFADEPDAPELAAEAEKEAEKAEAEEYHEQLAAATAAPADGSKPSKKRRSLKDHVNVSEQVEVQADGILSEKPFSTLDICDKMQRAITDMGFAMLTQVQHATIPPLLQGRDLLGAARTGVQPLLCWSCPFHCTALCSLRKRRCFRKRRDV